jgi:sugar lactone lactonase YvrE
VFARFEHKQSKRDRGADLSCSVRFNSVAGDDFSCRANLREISFTADGSAAGLWKVLVLQEETGMPDDIRHVVPAGDICGEGAVWHPEQNALYWNDINRFLVHRFEVSNQTRKTWSFEEPVTAVNLTTDPERLLLVLGSKVGLWSPCTHPQLQAIFRLSAAPEMRFNDGRVDPRGSLWVGTMRNNVGPQGEDREVEFSGGVLYRIDPDGGVSEWKTEIGISNTIAWSPDRRSFYFGDSPANTIYSFRYEERTGVISEESTFFAGYGQGLPDGSAMDTSGCLWNARYGGGCVIRIDPDGRVDRVVSLPVSNPTTCTFGGPELRTLYITSARSTEQFSGSVFAVETELGGIPSGRFQLL